MSPRLLFSIAVLSAAIALSASGLSQATHLTLPKGQHAPASSNMASPATTSAIPATGSTGSTATTGALSDDVAGSAGASGVSGAKQDGGAQGATPGWFARHREAPGYLAVAGVVLSLIAIGILIYQFFRLREVARFSQEIQKPAPRSEIAALAKRVDRIESAAPGSSAPQPRDTRTADTVRGMEQRLNELQQDLNSLKTTVQASREFASEAASRSLEQLRLELSGIAEAVLQDGSRFSTDHAAVADARSADGAGEALASAVNAWIRNRSTDHLQLLRMAEQAGLRQPQLGALDGGPASSASNFEITLNLGGDGAWVAVPVPGSGDFWAAPADAQFMTMGAAPMLLSQLFQGMEGAQQGFRFAAIYRPCRLRPVPGRAHVYTLQERGLLQLEGAPAAAERRPADLDAFVQAGAQRALAGRTRPVGQVLGAWIAMVARELEDHSRDLASLQEEATNPRNAAPPANPVDFSRLSREMSDLRREQEQIVAELRRRSEAVRETPPPRTSSPESLPPSVSARSQRPAEVLATPPQPRGELQREGASSGGDRPTTSASTTVPSTEREALAWAADQPGSEPGLTEVPSAEVYVRRVQALARAFGTGTDGSSVGIFHFVRRPGTGTLDLHATEPTADGAINCLVCHVLQSWQLAVLVGDPSGELQLFFPVGTLGKSNYAPGYSALIEDVPSGSFTVTPEQQPALLAPTDRAGAYTVLRKLILNGTAQSLSGRA